MYVASSAGSVSDQYGNVWSNVDYARVLDSNPATYYPDANNSTGPQIQLSGYGASVPGGMILDYMTISVTWANNAFYAGIKVSVPGYGTWVSPTSGMSPSGTYRTETFNAAVDPASITLTAIAHATANDGGKGNINQLSLDAVRFTVTYHDPPAGSGGITRMII